MQDNLNNFWPDFNPDLLDEDDPPVDLDDLWREIRLRTAPWGEDDWEAGSVLNRSSLYKTTLHTPPAMTPRWVQLVQFHEADYQCQDPRFVSVCSQEKSTCYIPPHTGSRETPLLLIQGSKNPPLFDFRARPRLVRANGQVCHAPPSSSRRPTCIQDHKTKCCDGQSDRRLEDRGS